LQQEHFSYCKKKKSCATDKKKILGQEKKIGARKKILGQERKPWGKKKNVLSLNLEEFSRHKKKICACICSNRDNAVELIAIFLFF